MWKGLGSFMLILLFLITSMHVFVPLQFEAKSTVLGSPQHKEKRYLWSMSQHDSRYNGYSDITSVIAGVEYKEIFLKYEGGGWISCGYPCFEWEKIPLYISMQVKFLHLEDYFFLKNCTLNSDISPRMWGTVLDSFRFSRETELKVNMRNRKAYNVTTGQELGYDDIFLDLQSVSSLRKSDKLDFDIWLYVRRPNTDIFMGRIRVSGTVVEFREAEGFRCVVIKLKASGRISNAGYELAYEFEQTRFYDINTGMLIYINFDGNDYYYHGWDIGIWQSVYYDYSLSIKEHNLVSKAAIFDLVDAANRKGIAIVRYDPAYLDVKLSPATVARSKNFGGAWDVSASLLGISVIKQYRLDGLDAQTVFENAFKLKDWIQKVKEGDVGIYAKWLSIDIDVFQNAVWIWLAANGWKITGATINTDGSMDFHAIWTANALAKISDAFVKLYIEFAKATVSGELTQSFKAVVLQEEQHKLYLAVTSGNIRIDSKFQATDPGGPFYFDRDNTQVVILPANLEVSSIQVDANAATQKEEKYSLAVVKVADSAIVSSVTQNLNIAQGSLDSFAVDFSSPRPLISKMEPQQISAAPLQLYVYVILVIAALSVAVFAVYRYRRSKTLRQVV